MRTAGGGANSANQAIERAVTWASDQSEIWTVMGSRTPVSVRLGSEGDGCERSDRVRERGSESRRR